VEGTGNNYVKWCKYLVVHYDFPLILSKFAFFVTSVVMMMHIKESMSITMILTSMTMMLTSMMKLLMMIMIKVKKVPRIITMVMMA
jgi:hypothetical protein